MADYTEDELIAAIRRCDTAVEAILSGSGVLKYTIGSKTVDRAEAIRLWQAQRKLYSDWLAMGAGGVKEVSTPVDYEVRDSGQQVGQRPDRPLGSEGSYDQDW